MTLRKIHDHAVFETTGDGRAARQWLIDNVGGLDVLSYGQQIELYKSVGDPDLVAIRYDLMIKIIELREIVDWQVPIYVKVGAARPY